eukprot:TRINITY_DN7951_c0_g1_i1.p1 TRINITY_DN7951_c0_g1~~TRINITY_DN7951_c0_g1_i1.p1  ORF type:complete len:1507 (+),score=446.67 TRINITY_DN7951_c0_g1_i1:4529-9049(+)
MELARFISSWTFLLCSNSLERCWYMPSIFPVLFGLKDRSQTDIVYWIGKALQHRMTELEKERLERNAIRKQLFTIRDQELEKPKLRQDAKLLENIQLELELLTQALPDYVQFSKGQNQLQQLKIAKLMVGAAYERKKSLIPHKSQLKTNRNIRQLAERVDDITLDVDIANIIDHCLQYVVAPRDILDLAEFIKNNGSYDIAVDVAMKAIPILNSMKEELRSFYSLKVARSLKTTEKKRIENAKKEPSPELLSEIEELNQKIDNWEWEIYADDLRSTDAIEECIKSIAEFVIRATVDYKRRILTKQENIKNLNGTEPLTTKELSTLSNLDNLIKSKLDSLLVDNVVDNPNHMKKIADLVLNLNELDHIPFIGEKIRERISVITEEIKELDSKLKKLKELTEIREKCTKEWKELDPMVESELSDIEFETKLEKVLNPDYKTGFRQYDLDIKIIKFCLSSVYKRRDDFEKAIQEEDIENPTPEQVIVEKRNNFATEISLTIDDVENPYHLYSIAKFVKKNNDGDRVKEIGEKCQARVEYINKLKDERAPFANELDELLGEQKDLLERNREVPEKMVARIEELEASIQSLPPFPGYASLHYRREFEELNLNVVRVMTNAILDKKVELEKKIAIIYENTHPSEIDHKQIEKERKTIQVRIKDLAKECIRSFSNPSYLLKFLKDMRKRNESELVVQVCSKIIDSILEIKELRKVRKPIVLKIDEANAEIQELISKKKDPSDEKIQHLENLKKELEFLPPFPHFADVYSSSSEDMILFKALHSSMDTSLSNERALEKSIKTQIYFDRVSVDWMKISDQRDHARQLINDVIDKVLQHIIDPKNLIKILKVAVQYPVTWVITPLANKALELLRKLEQTRAEKEQLLSQIEVLETEKTNLASRKRTLPDAVLADLENMKRISENTEYPPFLKNADQHNSMFNDIFMLISDYIFKQKKKLSKKIETNEDEWTQEYIDEMVASLESSEVEIIEILTSCQDPTTSYKICNSLKTTYKEYGACITLGRATMDILGELQKRKVDTEKKEGKRKKLLEEERELESARKQLSSSAKRRLRMLEVLHKLSKYEPEYKQDHNDYPSKILELALLLIFCPVDEFEEYERASEMDEYITSENVEQKRAELQEITSNVVSFCLEYISEFDHLINICKKLKERKQFVHCITVGTACEAIIQEFWGILASQQECRDEFEMYDQERIKILFGREDGDDSPIPPELEGNWRRTKKIVSELKPPKYTEEDLNAYLLEVADLVEFAADAENLDRVLQEQVILAFRAETTMERWEKVRNVTPDDQWDYIKSSLVEEVLKQEGGDDEKVRMLLKDELYDHCLKIFPKPTGDASQLTLLEELYEAIETKRPDLLEKTIVVIGRYLTFYFANFDFNTMDHLLDRLQKRFPSVLPVLYKKSLRVPLQFISPGQYDSIVRCLRTLKTRLKSIGKDNEWSIFYDDFVKEFSTKKKLMQMVVLLQDSRISFQDFSLGKKEEVGNKRKRRSSKGKSKKKRKKD